jgi:hydroxyacylglutathione hydrolase
VLFPGATSQFSRQPGPWYYQLFDTLEIHSVPVVALAAAALKVGIKEGIHLKTEKIHPIKIFFGIPISPDKMVERSVYAYLIDGERLCLVDTGVAGAEKDISIALQKIDKKLSDVSIIILTHSHPDRIGAASLIQHKSGAQVYAHPYERTWIEDVDRQAKERPVPGFANLVAGSVVLDRLLVDRDVISLGEGLIFRVLHTPGHSSGSISLLSEEDGFLFSGDLIPQPDNMPIYEDVAALANSLVLIADIKNLTELYSSWNDPLFGRNAVDAILAGMRYLVKAHTAAMAVFSEYVDSEPMELCRRWIRKLGLPPFAANPLVLRSLLSHKEAGDRISLESIFSPILKEL